MLQWLQEEFRPYLEEWKSSVCAMDIPTKEQNKKFLSQETLCGIDVAGTYVALSKTLLD